ncbi:MAG: class II aldolase/adducin family protein [Victivallaceae bacterium]|nr:class II aldolase/adducin family protein [Victivallaceae bacterium]
MRDITIEHPKDQIVEIMRRIYGYGMTTTSGGNLSILDNEDNMWISPGGIDKGSLQREDIICVKADGTIIGRHKPSSEFPFHRAIYKMRPDVRGILHAHPPALVSFSIAKKIPDTSVLPNARSVCGEVGYAPYAIPGSEELGRNIAQVFAKGHSTVLLENHGAVTIGSSLFHAFKRFETLDFCARLLNHAYLLGKPTLLTPAEIEFSLIDRNSQFHATDDSVRSSQELELRYHMCNLIRRAYRQQLFTSTEGSFAVRLDDKRFLVTPYGKDRDNLEPEDLILVDGHSYEKGKPLSRAAWFFRAIFDRQPEINSLIISHAPHVMAYGVANEPFDPRLIPESYILLREMPVFEYGTHYRNVEDVAKVISPRQPVIIIRNECLLTSGKTLLEAYDRMEVAEFSAKAALSARTLGGLKAITDEETKALVKAFKLPE